MNKILWEMPGPSSARTRGLYLVDIGKRRCELGYYVEADDGGDRKAGIYFNGVEAYKCTYMTACGVKVINTAYDKIVQLGNSQ
jgi:hypothetical protein